MPEERVYVIGTPGSRTVKIGRTNNVAKRFGEIQRMSPVPLALLWSHPGGHELETRLHRQFSALRVHGEWFCFQNDPIILIQWAVTEEPWTRKRLSLKKAPRRVPSPREPRVFERGPSMTPAQQASWEATRDELRNEITSAIYEIDDPVERYRVSGQVEKDFTDAFRDEYREIVIGLKTQGRTWREVGEALGFSAQRAQQVANGQWSGAKRQSRST